MDDIYKRAVDMQLKMRDYLDDRSHPLAGQFQAMFQRLVDDIESQKNPRTLEDEVKQILRQLDAAEGTPVMSDQHLDDLIDRSEDIRQALRQLQ